MKFVKVAANIVAMSVCGLGALSAFLPSDDRPLAWWQTLLVVCVFVAATVANLYTAMKPDKEEQ